jgi:FtsH-binding integral membrane protein
MHLTNAMRNSLISIPITFIVCVVVLYTTKPIWVQKIVNGDKTQINVPLVCLYSLLAGLIVSLGVLIYTSKNQEEETLPLISNTPQKLLKIPKSAYSTLKR